jgi:F0F1-type ATP synthase membrane subunit c/vacuolar-type H+-ATPase subunit K
MNTPQQNQGKTLAKIGAFLQLGFLFGLAATAIGMMHSFDSLAKANVNDPRELAGEIGEILIFSAIGSGIGLIGLVIIFVALFTTPYRSPWIFWLILIEGILLLFAFPIGTAIGVSICLYCLTHNIEFFRGTKQSSGEIKSDTQLLE